MHQNRVDPWSRIVAAPARGTLMGNRGVLHDPSGAIVRNASTVRWISCELEFKDRQRPILQPGRYTELFFLDEATALAAGHRPCFECRRADVNSFRSAWMAAFGLVAPPSAREMDLMLDQARAGSRLRAQASGLPDAVMVAVRGIAWLLHGDQAYEWSHDGYLRGVPRERIGNVEVLTPTPTLRVLAHGYTPRIHESATSGESL